MSFVRTILGDISPQQMGLTFSHEHVVIEEGFATVANKDFILNDVNKIAEELNDFYTNGGRTLVDTMPANCGRNVLKLAEVSRRTGINIIAPTGIHLEKYYPATHWRYHLSADELTDLFIKDVKEGIDEYDYGCPLIKRTIHKAGLIKLATGDEAITPHQEKIFQAVTNTHRQTGVPILTHTNNGKHAMAQVELFLKLGADINHVVISHVDKCKDLSYHTALMQTGVYVEYDSHFRWKNEDDNWTYTLLEKILPDFAEQVTVGMDMARNSYWKSYGGQPGLNYLLTTFRHQMKKRGLSEYLEKIFIANPQKLFCFHKN
ncbi:MAG: phosphotriesterase family protein [Chitinophagaceae bacterium]